MAKYLLIAAVVISLITAGLGYKNYTTLTETKASLDSTGAALVTTKKTLDTTKKELAATTGTLTTTTADKDKLAADLAAAQSAQASAEGKLKEATDASAAKDAQVASATADLEKANAELVTLRGGTKDDGGTVVENPRIVELEALVASLQEKLKAGESQLAGYRTQEEARKTRQLQDGLEGRVLAVNSAWNFVVLSIGDRQGVVANAELLLKRGGQYLGKVRITSVEPGTSIADIVANTLPAGVAVEPGDSVIFQKSTEN